MNERKEHLADEVASLTSGKHRLCKLHLPQIVVVQKENTKGEHTFAS